MPYAAKAIVQHEFDVDHLNIWLTFRHPMRRSPIPQASPPVYDWMPSLGLWLLECDSVPLNIVASEWLDEFTLLLTSDVIGASPNKVTLEYDGPDEHLCTTWGKQWEPWGPITSLEGWPTTFKAGMIILWHGSVVSIPSGWHLCDGTAGTPNLQDRFVVGAGNTYVPGDNGGALTHTHAATQASHIHGHPGGAGLAAGANFTVQTASATPAITVPSANHLPPYYALCYIMKL